MALPALSFSELYLFTIFLSGAAIYRWNLHSDVQPKACSSLEPKQVSHLISPVLLFTIVRLLTLFLMGTVISLSEHGTAYGCQVMSLWTLNSCMNHA